MIRAEATAPVNTGVVFWSHDRGTAKFMFKLKKDGVNQSLPKGTLIPISLDFVMGDVKGKHIYHATIEDAVEGIVSIILKDNILWFQGKVTGSIYIELPDSRSLDTAGRFTFDIKRSPIDMSTPPEQHYYWDGFHEILEEYDKTIEHIRSESKKLLDDLTTNVNNAQLKVNKLENDIETANTNLNNRIDEIHQKIDNEDVYRKSEVLTKEESYANVINQVIGKEKVQTKISIDFLDKITGSDVENPNWSGALLGSNSLPTPNLFKSEVVQERYNSLMYLDQKIVWASGGAANQSPCLLVKWNIIEILKRQLTESFFVDRGAITLQQQIETARMILTVINPSVWGYGVSATGNKLNYRVWVNNNSWGGTRSNNTSTIAKMEYTSTGNATNNYISDDGFLYALVYSEPSDGTSSSTIYVDYARLDLTLELSARDHIEYMIAANHVENLATQEEAETGEDNTKTMTPLRVFQSIAKWTKDKFISKTENESIFGVKDFLNGLQVAGNNVLSQNGEIVFDHTSETDSSIQSGIVRFKRYGDWVLVNFNFQCRSTNINSGGNLISVLEADIIPSGSIQVDITYDKALTIDASGKVTALWGLDANKYYVGSAMYFAKNKL